MVIFLKKIAKCFIAKIANYILQIDGLKVSARIVEVWREEISVMIVQKY